MCRVRRFLKRLIDVILASVALVALLPVFAVIALLVKSTSEGPAIYRQERVGMNGVPFVLLKFRTMVHNAEEVSGPTLSTLADKRVTPVGRILRRLRLDELPQLMNILKGEMSLVGPRPERPFFVKQYAATIPRYEERHSVKPGLTGLAQVLGTYSTSAEEKLKYDLQYIREHSILLDFRIMLMTIPVIFRPEASQGIRPKGLEKAQS